MKYLGDYADNQVIRVLWSTNNTGGGSSARTTAGTIVVEDMQALTGPINYVIVAGAVCTISDIAHGLVTGDDVIIYGSSTSAFNQKAFTITVVDANSYTMDFDATGLSSGSGGTWRQVNIADVTDTANQNGIVGMHKVEVDTSADDYFVAGRDYSVNIINCVVDSQPVDSVIAHFSIENRSNTGQSTQLSTSLAAVDTVVDAILVDTAVIGAAGAGLTAVPWNAAWDAEVQSECTDSLTAYDPPTKAEMDSAHSTTDGKIDVVDGIVDNILTDTAEIGVAGAGLTAVVWNAAWDAEVQSEVADALAAYDPPTKAEMDSAHSTTNSKIDVVDGVADSILLDTAVIGAAGAGLTDLGGMSTGMKGEVNSEADSALADYDAPTNAEMEARTLVAASYFDPAADTVASVTLVATATTVTNTINANVEQISGSNVVETSSGRVVGNFNTFFDNGNAATTKTVNDVGSTVIVGPVQTVTSPGNFVGSPTTLQIFQKESKTVTFSVVDGSGTVVDLSGKTLRFMVITDSNTPTAVFKVDSGDITITGSSNEVVTVSISAALSDTAVADHVWRLWDVSNSDVYAHGPFQILPALADTA